MKKIVPTLITALLAGTSFGSLACNVGHAQTQTSGSEKPAAAVGPKHVAKKHALKSLKQPQGHASKEEKAVIDPVNKRVEPDHPKD